MLSLAKALRVNSNSRIAFTGAGGKTTGMFVLARELLQDYQTVLVTTSTHLAERQVALGDVHWRIEGVNEFPTGDLPQGIIVVTGGRQAEGRISGLSSDLLHVLEQTAARYELPLLVEADGSRMLPLKAPAVHEPAVPTFADKVVVTAGLSGLGQPLDANHVHRPEIFSALSGRAMGDLVAAADLASVLIHPEGGLKGVPLDAERIALLNQADTALKQAAASRISQDLGNVYDTILVASLERKAGVYSAHEKIAAVILAAGGSKRLGQSKQLLDWRGKTLVQLAAEKAFRAGCSPVIVVTGSNGDQVAEVLGDLPVVIAENPDWEAGQSSSVKTGLEKVPARAGGALFILVDQPFVGASLLQALIDQHARNLSPITAPLIDQQRGNPVLFDRQTFPHFADVQGDVGGRPLFSKFTVDWLPWHDSRALLDIDTITDYQDLKELD